MHLLDANYIIDMEANIFIILLKVMSSFLPNNLGSIHLDFLRKESTFKFYVSCCNASITCNWMLDALSKSRITAFTTQVHTLSTLHM
jgi:hypothetical protein